MITEQKSRARRPDNFDALRLAAALAVVVGHAFVLTGEGAVPRVFGIPLHTLGVAVFFSISGNLVSGSWEVNPSVRRFLVHRFLRIFPALIVVVVLTVFAIGPLVTRLPLAEYFSSASTYSYLWTVTLFAQYDLPGVFKGAEHVRTAVNGSLWSLGVEFLCYFLVLAIGRLPRRARTVGYFIAAVLAAGLSIAAESWGEGWFHALAPSIEMVVFFVAAAVIRATDVRLTALRCLGIVVVWVLAATLVSDLSFLIAWVAVPVLVTAVGRASTPGLRSIHRLGDLSYGTYLWAFLIQQIVIDRMPNLPLFASLAIVMASSLTVAWCS